MSGGNAARGYPLTGSSLMAESGIRARWVPGWSGWGCRRWL